jgi:hypothetical protein
MSSPTLNHNVIRHILPRLEGHNLSDPEGLIDEGLPADFIESLTEILESGSGKDQIYIDDKPVNQIRAVRDLKLLHCIAGAVGADLRSVVAVGRGTQGRQYITAIEEALS